MRAGCRCLWCTDIDVLLHDLEGVLRHALRLNPSLPPDHQEPYLSALGAVEAILETGKPLDSDLPAR